MLASPGKWSGKENCQEIFWCYESFRRRWRKFGAFPFYLVSSLSFPFYSGKSTFSRVFWFLFSWKTQGWKGERSLIHTHTHTNAKLKGWPNGAFEVGGLWRMEAFSGLTKRELEVGRKRARWKSFEKRNRRPFQAFIFAHVDWDRTENLRQHHVNAREILYCFTSTPSIGLCLETRWFDTWHFHWAKKPRVVNNEMKPLDFVPRPN